MRRHPQATHTRPFASFALLFVVALRLPLLAALPLSPQQVSCTVTFDPDTEGDQLQYALDYYQYQLKGISFLPRATGVYDQMPYEEITSEEYERRCAQLGHLDWSSQDRGVLPTPDKFCDREQCSLDDPPIPLKPEPSTE